MRPPAVAGLFYPDDARVLRAELEALLARIPDHGPVPKALIAPHAGYIYSGPIAASAYARIRPIAARIRRVVLLGPAHRLGFHGVAASSARAFATPLGAVTLDREAIECALTLPQVRVLDAAHAEEHSLEVHLPFLQLLLADFRLAPFVVGEAASSEVAELLDLLWGGDETLIVVSSDLSHYHRYERARELDAATTRAIEALRPQDIHYEQACGRNPVNGLLVAARERGLAVETLDLRNSGDTAGDHARVVGYGAWAFH
jgi:AmmeMemoRadiSam system protein B